MLIKIRPLDTLFFRDGKPFTKGEDNWATTTFPPSPSVIYGALRSSYFSHHIDELPKAAEKDDPTKNLRITAFYFADSENNIYLPLPEDCIQKKDQKTSGLLLNLVKIEGIVSSCPANYCLKPPKLKDNGQVERINDGLIKLDSLNEYLKGKKKTFQIKQEKKKNNGKASFSIIKLQEKVLLEPKVGIGLDRKKGTADTETGLLYHVSMNRLKDFYIMIEFDGLELEKKGLLKLGGEGKVVSYDKEKELIFNVDKLKFEDNKFKLYLSTPGIFDNGWFPGWLDQKTLRGTYTDPQTKEEIELELLTAAIGKYKSQGGFDMKKKRPKPMYRMVPSGSVYYFKVLNRDTAQQAYDILNRKAISDVYKEQGFGLAYVGKI
jgi:CRISPR-associated protein Cmr3